MNFNNFSCLSFEPKMCQYPQPQKYPRGVKFVNSPKLKNTPAGKMCQYPQAVYYFPSCQSYLLSVTLKLDGTYKYGL